jgi:hypothetical protein
VAFLPNNDVPRQITSSSRLELLCCGLLVVTMNSQHDQRPFDAPGSTVLKQPDNTLRLGGMAEQRACYGEQFDSGHVVAYHKSRLVRYRAGY